MVLAEWDGNWYLSTGINSLKGQTWLRAGRRMPHPAEFKPLPPIGAVVYGPAPVAEVRFYPQLRWEGFPVWPFMWDIDSACPRLQIHMSTHTLPATDERSYMELVELMRAAGWGWDIMEGGFRYVHPDELDKIEGMPAANDF